MPKGKTQYDGEAMSFKEMIDYAAGVRKRGVSPNIEKYPKKLKYLMCRIKQPAPN